MVAMLTGAVIVRRNRIAAETAERHPRNNLWQLVLHTFRLFFRSFSARLRGYIFWVVRLVLDKSRRACATALFNVFPPTVDWALSHIPAPANVRSVVDRRGCVQTPKEQHRNVNIGTVTF
jgi:hypothetical protein